MSTRRFVFLFILLEYGTVMTYQYLAKIERRGTLVNESVLHLGSTMPHARGGK